ncbi:XAC0095 family protein [Dyella flava]|uniref:Uncharacterized protein n=1 Tax=Dyella flava TaxID=1920170 RepID=A0ABS2K0D0_9GAMM|nr:hypothetical protein [Dyella flava]MBM7124709.1 hypothetical protein [Dyella flava]GLQ50754.1 hypothetical protein GCM10010872_22030 [Dyella flava]
MEDIYGDPSGPRDYLLTAEEYDQLKNLQQLLLIMADVAYDEDQQAIESEPTTIPRWEVQLSFRLISGLIGEALEHLEKRNHIERQSPVRH